MYQRVNLRLRASGYPRGCVFGDDFTRRKFDDACDELIANTTARYVVGPASNIKTAFRGMLGPGAPIGPDDIEPERSLDGKVIRRALVVFNGMLAHREVLENEDFKPTPEAA